MFELSSIHNEYSEIKLHSQTIINDWLLEHGIC